MGDKEKTTEKLHFIEEKKLAHTIELEKVDAAEHFAAQKAGNNLSKAVTNPIQCALLKFAQSKHKFGLKDF